jgi:hypothetical protein
MALQKQSCQTISKNSNTTRTRQIKPVSKKMCTKGKGRLESKKSMANAGMA